jgi:hypothetical protein
MKSFTKVATRNATTIDVSARATDERRDHNFPLPKPQPHRYGPANLT